MSVRMYSVEQVLSQSGGDKRFVRELMELFVKVTPEVADGLKTAVKEKDAKTIGQLAHKIKPSLQILQVHDASALAIETEISANEGHLNYMRVTELITLLDKCVAQVKEDISTSR
jgi:HPt (histidine-containing phosphotransfer) domain-containing protein